MEKSPVKIPKQKKVCIVESDLARQKEIKESVSHQTHWEFLFFNDANDCLSALDKINPLVFLLDLQHFDENHDESYGFGMIGKFKQKSKETEVLIFSEIENEQWASAALKHGALDYILINPHQYVKMEYELQWLETVKDRQSEDKKFISNMGIVIALLVAFIFMITILYQMGLLKEGNDTELLIGA